VLGAYRKGIVPLPASGDYFATLNEFRYSGEVATGTIAIVGDAGGDPYSVAWWSPDPRPVIGVGRVHLGRNVRKRLRHDALTTSADAAFGRVVEACRAGREPRWLTDQLVDTLTELHGQGWAHSIEVWRDDDLVGGAMGIGIGGVISGDSLFGRRGAHRRAVGRPAAALARRHADGARALPGADRRRPAPDGGAAAAPGRPAAGRAAASRSPSLRRRAVHRRSLRPAARRCRWTSARRWSRCRSAARGRTAGRRRASSSSSRGPHRGAPSGSS